MYQIWRCSNVNMISATSRVLLCFIEKCRVNIFQNISFLYIHSNNWLYDNFLSLTLPAEHNSDSFDLQLNFEAVAHSVLMKNQHYHGNLIRLLLKRRETNHCPPALWIPPLPVLPARGEVSQRCKMQRRCCLALFPHQSYTNAKKWLGIWSPSAQDNMHN